MRFLIDSVLEISGGHFRAHPRDYSLYLTVTQSHVRASWLAIR